MKDFFGILESRSISRIDDPVVVVEKIEGVSYGELVEVCGFGIERRYGVVLEMSEKYTVVQVFRGAYGLSIDRTTVRFLGKVPSFRVSQELLGRILNGSGQPIDGFSLPVRGESRFIYGSSINPAAREYPSEIIETGISVIDGMATLVKGQKLPIFSVDGLPHNEIAAQIARQANITEESGELAIIFVAMGIKNDEAFFFREEFENSGALSRAIMFLNLASDPVEESIIAPRYALTLAEYLAFECGMDVLVIMTDMTNYCNALREISSIRNEIPTRKGYPGYLYSDLASIYERCGRIKGRKGSITQIPILTMPGDDITHPVPDTTGYITEGQLVLDRMLHDKGIYPPLNPLPSLSRLMKDTIGDKSTREDHADVASQLYSAYAKVQEIRSLATIIGEEDLAPVDRIYLKFGEEFEKIFINQGKYERRSIHDTLNKAWHVLSILPIKELHRIRREFIEKYRVSQ